jgi:hypothetical protein
MSIKQILAILVLSLFVGSIMTAGVTNAPPAQAKQAGCDYHNQTWYLGVKAGEPKFGLPNIDGHKRFAELNAYGKGCSSSGEKAKDAAGYLQMDIYENSYSRLRGFEWHVSDGHEVSSNRWWSEWEATGWFRGCAVYNVPFVCGPTGTFKVHLRYMSDWFMHHSTGVHQFTYHLTTTNRYAYDMLTRYNTP